MRSAGQDEASARETRRSVSHTDSVLRTELERRAWPRLDEGFVGVLRAEPSCREIELFDGEALFEVGHSSYDFAFILEGAIRIVDRAGDKTIVVVHASNFIGELGMLMGQGTFLAGVAQGATRVLVLPQSRLQELVATVPEIADPVVSAFAARRRLLIEWNEGGLVIVGREGDADTVRLLTFASRNRIPHRFADRDDPEEVARLAGECRLPPDGAAVIVGQSVVLERPQPREVAVALGMDLPLDGGSEGNAVGARVFDLAVIGAGPSGLASAVYGASEGLSTIVIEDTAIGGQAGTSSRIENYLGFSTGVSGSDLAYEGEIQAVKFGARFAVPRRATGIERTDDYLSIGLDDGSWVRARAAVLASGVQYRKLPLERIEEFEGAGIYYAATELEARFCRNTDAVIVGGGNSAGQAAMFLSRHARCTHILVRGEGLGETMSSYLMDRIDRDERIRLWTWSEIVKLDGNERLERVTIRNVRTGEERLLDTRALFVMIGAAPNTAWLPDNLDLDNRGFVVTGHGGDSYATSMHGVWAVGDLRSGSVKRVASAVGEGSVVVSSVHRYLAAHSKAPLS